MTENSGSLFCFVFEYFGHLTLFAHVQPIPKKFLGKFGDELSSIATLTLPNGHDWLVGLTKDEGKVWFHHGWHDFVEYHSICVGYFVVFKYAKNSNFRVLIFDTTACEIPYPSRKMCSPSLQNQANYSPASARSSTFQNFAATLDSLKFKNHGETQGKQCEMKEVEVKHEPVDVYEARQGRWKENEMYNSQGTLKCKRDPSKLAEHFCPPGTSFQDLDIKTTTHNVKDKHGSKVIGNGSELKKAAYEVRNHIKDEPNKGTKLGN